MSEKPAADDNGREIDMSPGSAATEANDAAPSTVGTGSVIGLGCLALVVVFVVLAIAYRLLGGSW